MRALRGRVLKYSQMVDVKQASALSACVQGNAMTNLVKVVTTNLAFLVPWAGMRFLVNTVGKMERNQSWYVFLECCDGAPLYDRKEGGKSSESVR